MTTKRLIWAIVAVAVLALGLSAWAYSSQDPITQGDFAVLLASHLKTAVPQGGWTPESAASFLGGLGLAPLSGGWEVSAQLNEGNMVHVLRVMGLALYSTAPDTVVTWGKANGVFYRYDDFFKNYNLKIRTVQGIETTHIDTGVGGTESAAPAGNPLVPPASPTLP